MRKTFLKVALIGLLVGSLPVGFTSCKDYDDDIEQTNNQVADLKTKLASVETAIAALPSKADVTAAQAAAVAQAKADLEAVKAELQKAIDGKADKEAVEAINTELSSIKGQLETIEALKGQVSEAMDAINASIDEIKADAVTKGQMIAGLEAQIAELKDAQGEGATNVAALTEELNALKTAVEDPTSGIAALKDQIAKLAEQIQGQGGEAASLEATLRVVNGMVTGLRIVEDWGASKHGKELWLFNPVKVTNTPVGPRGEALLFNIKKDEVKTFTDSLLVQVSPSGATLTQDQLTLVNSQLKGIEDYVAISNVRAFNGKNDLLSRAASSNGLYVVYFTQAPGYDPEKDAEQAEKNDTPTDFAKATITEEGKGKQIRFAIALNETNEGGSRDVMTPYDITVSGGQTKPTDYLDYNVDDTWVGQIHNRFLYAEDGSSFMYLEKDVTDPLTNMTPTYKAAGPIASFEAARVQGYAPVGDYAWNSKGIAAYAKSDNRNTQPFYNVDLDEPFVVSLNGVSAKYPIYGYYVALDMLRATESDQSEKVAWSKYADNIIGINKVFNCAEDIKLTIKKEADVPGGDVIGFRVWAVNYDGTLVDPDGRAFYVQVGEVSDVETAPLGLKSFVATDATLADKWNIQTGIKYADKLSEWTTAYDKVWVDFQMDNASKPGYMAAPGMAVTVTLGNDIAMTSTAKANRQFATSTSYSIPAKEYTKAFNNISVSVNGVFFVDNYTYTGYIYIWTDQYKNRLLQQIPVNITKTLPTVLPAWFGVTAGLTNAAGDICIFANPTKTADAVTASFGNVFINTSDNNSLIAPGNKEWENFAFGIMIQGAQGETWANPATPAYFTNMITGVDNPMFSFKSWYAAGGSPVYGQKKNPTNLNLNGGTGAIVSPLTNTTYATLPVINSLAAQDITIWYKYVGVSYVANSQPDYYYPLAATYDEDGNPETGRNTVGSGSKKLRVQTYPATYKVNAPAMPTLSFGKYAAINVNAISVSSTWTSAIKNVNLTNIVGYSNKLYKINTPVEGDMASLFSLTGNIDQYFDIAYVKATVEIADNSKNVVTVKTAVSQNGKVVLPAGTVVSGIATTATTDTTTGKVTYALSNGSEYNVVAFVPADLMNAPAQAVTGNLNLNYFDCLGLGSGFDYDDTKTVIPYSAPFGVTMQP